MEDNNSNAPNWIAGVAPPSELLTRSMNQIYEMECREQPARLESLLRAYQTDTAIRTQLDKLRQMALSAAPILFIGMGASYCSSITGSTYLQSCDRSSFTVDAGEWLHYSSAWKSVALSLLVTTSGESAELVQLCRRGTDQPTALLCNNEKSACWSSVQNRLPILAGPEYGNATKTYTNATAACIIIAAHISGLTWQEDAEKMMRSYPDTLNHVFSLRKETEEFCRGAANIEVIGRGPAYGGAIMGALCIREMTGQRAAPHTGGGFRHGPLLDVNQSHVAIILALGKTASLGVSLAQDCLARGGRVILVSTEERQRSERLFPIRIDSVPEPWQGLTSVLVPQALTLAIAERVGAKLSPRFQYAVMNE
jgi:glucosamine--fructose-6-phosphate aminotransferase (isomerizing)